MAAFLNTELAVSPEEEGERLDRFLVCRLPGLCPGLRAGRRLCGEGRVLVRGRQAVASHRLHADETVQIVASVPQQPAKHPFLVWQGAGLAAICKPAGLATVRLAGGSRPSLEDMIPTLLTASASFSPRLLNRLDNQTSGLVLAALNEEGFRLWRQAEASGGIRKYYLAVCRGRLEPGNTRVIQAPLDTRGRRITRVLEGMAPQIRSTEATGLAVLEEKAALPSQEGPRILTLVGCRIFKGARHQIRAHMASIGLPLYSDALYGSPAPGSFRLHHARFVLGSIAPLILPDWLETLPIFCRSAAKRWLAEMP